MLKFVFLSGAFYSDYANCSEIEKKKDRPHAQVTIEVGGHLFCVPFRSNITHKHALFTDKANKCGLDFSKAVVITDSDKYIDQTRKPYLRSGEFAVLKTLHEYTVSRMLKYYIASYQKAKRDPGQPHNATLLKFSTLQYFEEYL